MRLMLNLKMQENERISKRNKIRERTQQNTEKRGRAAEEIMQRQ